MAAVPSRKGIKMDGMSVMSSGDKNFIKSFGICAMTRLPCTPKLTEWVGFVPNITFKGYKALTKSSFIMCSMGGKVAPQTTGQRTARNESEKIVCPLCDKDILEHKFQIGSGNNVGHSTILGGNILQGADKKNHKFAMKPYFYYDDDYDKIVPQNDNFNQISQDRRRERIFIGDGIEAHHLICSEAMESDPVWEIICKNLYYDINKRENGVFLPTEMDLACHLHVPLHRGNHAAGFADGFERYVKSVKKKLDEIKTSYRNAKPCDEERSEQLNSELDTLSTEILNKISTFTWTITRDGSHYHPSNPVGCSNARHMSEKLKQRVKIKDAHNTNSQIKITIKSMEELRAIHNLAYNAMNLCSKNRIHHCFNSKPTKNTLIIST